MPLWSQPGACIPLGSGNDGGTTPPGQTPNPTPGPSPASTCKMNNGASGTCIDTGSCTSQGGTHEAGHCPGGSNIQCCTKPSGGSNPPPTSCKVTSGLAGTCIDVSVCAGQGGYHEAGHCPGAANIQCCTSSKGGSDPPPPASTPTCKANSGLAGHCISTTACKSQGGYSEAGHCPGATDIQCCTYPKGSGDTCTAKGVTGTCMPTSSCPDSTGKSIPGYCSGPADVQCCVSKAAADKASRSELSSGKKICSIDKAGLPTSGFVGECIGTGACKSGGGTSTPGFCPGSSANQCCTYGTCKGMDGVCEPVGSCQGTITPGHCGGGKDIQCCTPNWDTGNLHPGVE